MGDDFEAQTRQATQGSGLLIGMIGIVAVGAWSGMDLILHPGQAEVFIALRGACITAMAVICVLLRTPLGARSPEALVLALTAMPQLAIAAMISRLTGAYAPYATGFSLVSTEARFC